jgi:hypothetical protein
VAEVVVDKIDFCGSRNAARNSEGQERQPEVTEPGGFEDLGGDDGELPF